MRSRIAGPHRRSLDESRGFAAPPTLDFNRPTGRGQRPGRAGGAGAERPVSCGSGPRGEPRCGPPGARRPGAQLFSQPSAGVGAVASALARGRSPAASRALCVSLAEEGALSVGLAGAASLLLGSRIAHMAPRGPRRPERRTQSARNALGDPGAERFLHQLARTMYGARQPCERGGVGVAIWGNAGLELKGGRGSAAGHAELSRLGRSHRAARSSRRTLKPGPAMESLPGGRALRVALGPSHEHCGGSFREGVGCRRSSPPLHRRFASMRPNAIECGSWAGLADFQRGREEVVERRAPTGKLAFVATPLEHDPSRSRPLGPLPYMI